MKVPVGKGLTNHPYRVLRLWRRTEKKKISPNKIGEAYTENCAGRREYAAPENWHSRQLRNQNLRIDEGFNVHRSQYRSIRLGKDVKGLRSQKVVACTKRYI